jgi:uncharacterized protein (DUF2384 family)
MDMSRDKDCVSTNTNSRQKKESNVLSQEELMRWWPFTRLDPKRFPKAKKAETHEEYEDALF